jgi:hypothetical protein
MAKLTSTLIACIALTAIHHDGEIYSEGDSIELPDTLSKRMINSGAVKLAPSSSPLENTGDKGGGNSLPTEGEIDALGFDALGQLLTSQGIDPKPFGSKDARRQALRDLIAKSKGP